MPVVTPCAYAAPIGAIDAQHADRRRRHPSRVVTFVKREVQVMVCSETRRACQRFIWRETTRAS
jgi:hypothetical protein